MTPDEKMHEKAEAIVDAYLAKCDRVHPDGSSSEDIECHLIKPPPSERLRC